MKIFNYNENYTLKLVHNQYNICMSQSIHEWFDECILYKTFRIIHPFHGPVENSCTLNKTKRLSQ